jgi:hypothetical protein
MIRGNCDESNEVNTQQHGKQILRFIIPLVFVQGEIRGNGEREKNRKTKKLKETSDAIRLQH